MSAPAGERSSELAGIRLVASSITSALRTPLHSFLGFGELLAMTDLDRDQRRLVEQMVDGADQLLLSCDRLALLVRLLAGEHDHPAERFELSELLGEVSAMASPTTPIPVRVHPRIPNALLGDAEALRHLLMELLINASVHGGRPITVALDLTGPPRDDALPVRLRVTDAGAGLPNDYLARLNAAQPVLPVEPRQIGLYLVRRLADRLGGQLTVAHCASGGTEVTLRMTLYPAPRVPVVVPRPRRDAEARPLRVLLVEDNNVNRLLTQRQLTKLGHHLDAVTNGQDGVAAALSGQYDIILMDRHLPDLDGIEATRQIRAAEAAQTTKATQTVQTKPHPGRRAAIIAVTADATAGHREECIAAGMDGFLTKPVDIEHLRAALVTFVASPERTDPGDGDINVNIDPDALVRLSAEVDGDPDVVAAMVRAYITELTGRRLRLQMAIRRSNARQAIATAESLRAASVLIGAVSVARVCARIIDATANNDFTTCHNALPELLDTCQRAAAALTPESELAPAAR